MLSKLGIRGVTKLIARVGHRRWLSKHVAEVGHQQWPMTEPLETLEGGRDKEKEIEFLKKCANFNSENCRIVMELSYLTLTCEVGRSNIS